MSYAAAETPGRGRTPQRHQPQALSAGEEVHLNSLHGSVRRRQQDAQTYVHPAAPASSESSAVTWEAPLPPPRQRPHGSRRPRQAAHPRLARSRGCGSRSARPGSRSARRK
eukprot:599846-Alexandrium_andersonii.AAC.1